MREFQEREPVVESASVPVQFYFDNLDPVSFQRLINDLLVARFGETIRLLPLRGTDGGRDAETAPTFQTFEVEIENAATVLRNLHLKAGRYFFQAKHHRLADKPGTSVRGSVVADFGQEITSNILSRTGSERVNYFFLITNVPSSKEAVTSIDQKRRELLAAKTDLHADVLWQEHLVSWLDQTPQIWSSFPELFAGMRVPALGQVANPFAAGVPSAIRLAIRVQAKRDGVVRFRQIDLEESLPRLFVDLDASRSSDEHYFSDDPITAGEHRQMTWEEIIEARISRGASSHGCIDVLTSEEYRPHKRFILEGGPGQGKSTVTQMLAQLYRALLLGRDNPYQKLSESISKARFPFRIELRSFAEWFEKTRGTIEEYLASTFMQDAGGAQITVADIHAIAEQQPVILICDGFDEVGRDDLRDSVAHKISECIERLHDHLSCDLRVIVTSRPPAIVGRIGDFPDFERIQISPLSDNKADAYVVRWIEVFCPDTSERERVLRSFNQRRGEKHVAGLVRNPMQLSILLHFIRLKGEAFPDRRAELYRDYFKTVIDRDVEKSPKFRENRKDIEALHEVVGFEVHARAETTHGATNLSHQELVDVVERWLAAQGRRRELARELFRLGQERLGLIVALQGEGTQSRYGFDVQPIREYFAAAFINDKSPINAHELFPALVRRPFWREVALFLAGLRRENEKADLLSRAKALDDESDEAWRSDGGTTVLQLLQEGVLTALGHVHADAISFLVLFLDPSNKTPRAEPKGLLTSLPALISSCDGEQPRNTIRNLLGKANHRVDRNALWRLWYVANRSLSSRELREYQLQYTSHRNDLLPLIRLLWPAEAKHEIADEVPGEPSTVPQAVWAESWFQAAFTQPSVTGLDATARYHELLFEQFAFQSLNRREHTGAFELIQPIKPYAVWRLCTNLQAIGRWLIEPAYQIQLPGVGVDYSGLSQSIVGCVKELIEASTSALLNLSRGRQSGWALRGFIKALEECLSQDGLPAWIACRCAVTLMGYLEAWHLLVDHGFYKTPPASMPPNSPAWAELRRRLTPFYRGAIPKDLDRVGRSLAAKITRYELHRCIPSHVRLRGELESVADLIGRPPDALPHSFSWVQRVPIARYWLPDLVRSQSAEKLLSALANRKLNWYGPRARTRRRDLRKILSVVRDSVDPAFLSGALFALVGSKFWDMADLAVLIKMLEADADFLDIGSVIFEQQQYLRRPMPPALLLELAEAVVKGKVKTSTSVGTAAAQFLLQNKAVKLRPLKWEFFSDTREAAQG